MMRIGTLTFGLGVFARGLFAAALVLTCADAALAARRALVIGVNDYREVEPLKKAVSDAQAVARKLEAKDFEVSLGLDLPRREINRKLTAFVNALRPGDTALFFFAGHGVEIDGENYLLPADVPAARPEEKDFVVDESIALSRVLDRIRASRATTHISIIDACRDNPFQAVPGRSVGGTRGLGRIQAPESAFVIFSAGAGQAALDRLNDFDDDPNSVFTRVFLPLMDEPGLTIRDIALRLKTDVNALAGQISHRQAPAYFDELLGDEIFAFTPAALSQAPDEGAARAAFETAKAAGSLAALTYVVEAFPGTIYAAMAEEALSALKANIETKGGQKDAARTAFEAAKKAGSRAGMEFVARNYRGSVFAAMAEEELDLMKNASGEKGVETAQPNVRVASAAPAEEAVRSSRAAGRAGKKGGGGALIQLGAFLSEDAAVEHWSAVSAANADLLSGMRVRIVGRNVGNTQFHRLHAGALPDMQAARDLCVALQGRGVECLVVAPGAN